MDGKGNELRKRISSVKNTKKITEAMRLVAAAKVRRAQDAVIKSRPFTETIQELFMKIVTQLEKEDIQLPLLEAREVKRVTVVGIAGDRGLCGAYNSYAIKKTEMRVKELLAQGLDVEIVTIGKKITQYFNRRTDVYKVKRSFLCGQKPTAEESGEITNELLAEFLSRETDTVEVIYSKFVSLISSEPSIRTLLPLKLSGIESEEDEVFELTSKDGKFSVNRTEVRQGEFAPFSQEMIFEQDPIQILNAILPLYLNGQILRILQESVASELASRMQAMQSASDNAGDLAKKLTLQYNRARQASVTQELMEIVAGAACANE